MDEVPENIVVADAAAQGARATIEREMIARGHDVRVIVFDDRDPWPTLRDVGQVGELVWCGVDLACAPDEAPMVEIPTIVREERLDLFYRSILGSKRTHPTTARELRRAERQRRR